MPNINYKILVKSLVLTLPVLGFISGLLMCTDCGWNIIFRIFIGIIYMFLTTISLGQPVLDEGSVNSIDLRIYIIPVFVILYFLLSYFSKRMKERKLKKDML